MRTFLLYLMVVSSIVGCTALLMAVSIQEEQTRSRKFAYAAAHCHVIGYVGKYGSIAIFKCDDGEAYTARNLPEDITKDLRK